MQIGHLMEEFRLAERDIFNNYFLRNKSLPWSNDRISIMENFSDLRCALFRSMIGFLLPGKEIDYGYPQEYIEAIPLVAEGVPAMINRERDSGYWDHKVGTVDGCAKLIFVEFFDWDINATRDNRYAKLLIANHRTQEDLIGRQCLIETINIRFSLIS